MWKVAVFCKKIGIVLFKNFNLLIYQQAVAILMWAPIQNFCSFFDHFHAFDERRTSRYQSWMPAMISLNDQPCKFQPCPAFYKLPTAVDGIRQESQSLENAAHLSNTAFLALHLLSLSVPTHSTHFTKQEPSCQVQTIFSGFSRLEELWSNMTFSDGFDLVFGSTGALCWCRNANEKFLQSGVSNFPWRFYLLLFWGCRTVNTSA